MREKLWVKQYASKMNRPLRAEIRKRYHSAKSSAALPVIVQFKHKITPSRMLALHRHLGAHSFAIKHRIPMLNALSSSVSVNCLKRLCCWEGVHKVHLDHIKSISLDIATPCIGAAAIQIKRGLTGTELNTSVSATEQCHTPDQLTLMI
ncbi:hypothetical protein AMQ83_31770, partial [Paenibacillus riograndensis]